MIGSQKMVPMVPKKLVKRDLQDLKELLEAGKISPVIDRSYTLSEVPEALRYYGKGHTRGKIVITVS
jgi:NADPH:quinone reductase-like Zn-dependent oxidoreductase